MYFMLTGLLNPVTCRSTPQVETAVAADAGRKGVHRLKSAAIQA